MPSLKVGSTPSTRKRRGVSISGDFRTVLTGGGISQQRLGELLCIALVQDVILSARILGSKCHVYFQTRWNGSGLPIDSSEIS